MKKLYSAFFMFCFLWNAASAQTLSNSNLPIIILDTYGQTIVDDPRITIGVKIIDNGFGFINNVNDTPNVYDGEVSIEIRGSTSQQYPKKAYAFETQDSVGNNLNVSLLGMPQENDWIFYAPYPDKTLLRNSMAFYLWRRMGHYASRTQHAEMVRNGDYRGVYELHEKIKRDNDRVDIAKLTPADTIGDELTGGYIIKIDKTTGSGTLQWNSPINNNVYFQFHDPEDTELLPVQRYYIESYVSTFETVLNSTWFANTDSGYSKYIDVNSFIDYMIMQELGRTVDGYRSSCFFYKDKDSKGGKITMGPLWDFNLSYGNANYCQAYSNTGYQYNYNSICTPNGPSVPFWWAKLLSDPFYANQLKCRWNELRQGMLHTDSINQWIDSAAYYLNDAQQRNFTKWPILGVYVNWNNYIGQTFSDEINYLKSWIEDRSVWLDANWPGACNVNIENIPASNAMIHVYPNPSNQFVFIHFMHSFSKEGLQLYLFDLNGRLIDQPSTKLDAQSNEWYFDVSKIQSGMYLLQVQNKFGQKAHRKLIVQQ
ncbi:MAG TPA: CotH kinase family protein [Bacteroidia bacterium]|nr:CotH kinase family protein [Bacteroidia bacterium]HNT80963.1 CotH kinase family protein [Bacteroidia bacterium]